MQADLDEWRVRLESIWRQKSRGSLVGTSTHFFHVFVIFNRKRNFIEAIKNDSSDWLFNEEDIRSHLLRKFSNLFTSSNMRLSFKLETLF